MNIRRYFHFGRFEYITNFCSTTYVRICLKRYRRLVYGTRNDTSFSYVIIHGMSGERSEKNGVPSPENMWGKILKLQLEGGNLTEEQLKALEIRSITLSVVDAMEQLVEDETVTEDPIKQAEITARYYEGILRLDDLGIKKGMHVGDRPDSFDNPNKIAEYLAGQVVGIETGNIPNIRHAIMQSQEHSDEGIDIGGITTYLLSPNTISPNLERFVVLRRMFGAVCRLLASDLDQPQDIEKLGSAK